MTSKNSKLVSHSSIYLLGSLLQRSVSFIMLPIYTRCLTPSDYGIIELLSMVIDFVGIFFGLRISQSIFRYYYKYEGTERDEVVSTALYLVLLANALGALILIIFSKPLSDAIFGMHDQGFRLSLFAVTLLSQGAISIPMIGLRAAQRPMFFVLVSVAKLFIQLSLNIYFVVIKGMNIDGVIFSALISTLLCGSVMSVYTILVRGKVFSRQKAKELVSFSLPLVLTDVLGFYVTFGDRYFLRIFGGLNEVGVYSLGYKFGFLLSFLVIEPFSGIWDTVKYEIALKDNYRQEFNRIFIIFSFVLIFVCLFISIFVKDFFIIMADRSFLEAYKIVPIVLAAYMMNAWCGFVNLGALLKNRPFEIFYGTVIAALVSTVGYLVLIPLMGAIGAAISAFVAFGSRLVWVYLRSKNMYDMGIYWLNVVPLLLLWGLAVFLSSLFTIEIIQSILYNLFIFVLMLFVVYYFPIIPKKVKKDIIGYCEDRLKAILHK